MVRLERAPAAKLAPVFSVASSCGMNPALPLHKERGLQSAGVLAVGKTLEFFSAYRQCGHYCGINPARRSKAPGDWRNPRPGGLPKGLGKREASWTAVALYRFSQGQPNSLAPFRKRRRRSTLPARPKPCGVPSGPAMKGSVPAIDSAEEPPVSETGLGCRRAYWNSRSAVS